MSRLQHDRLPRVTDVCADESEVLGLAIVRFIAAGAMTGDAACWDAAHDCAESVLGCTEGPALVAAMACLFRTIMRQQRSDFACLPATCCRVTPDEGELLALLSLCRRGHTSDVPVAAARLCGVADGAVLTLAVEAAVEALNRAQQKLRAPGDWTPFKTAASVH